jgi:flagellin-like hook-associated protein FlgL
MRVTYNYLNMRYLTGVQNTLNDVADGLEKVTKGRNLLNPEDDPVNYITALSIQTTLDEYKQFNRNAENALTWLENADNELQEASELLSNALNEYAVYGMNDSQNATSRKALAGDVQGIIDELLTVANASYMGRYLFSGYETQTEPYTYQDREVSSVVSNINGGEVTARKLYGDMPELEEGSYTMKVTVTNGVAQVSVYDSQNNKVLLDTNGSDESAGNGNIADYTLTTAYYEGMVINTGVGVGVKLPEGVDMEGRTLSVDYYYKPGDDITYAGDDGEITTSVGYSSDVTINVSGQQIFSETNRTLRSTLVNTSNGLDVTSTTYFSNIDGANANLADSIRISGTDHNGYKVGIAKLSAPSNVSLDMSEATEEERTVTLKYADEEFDLTVAQKGYQDMDDVVYALNRELEKQGLGSEISAVNDGDRVMFISSRAGDHVEIQAKGSINNKLGFEDSTPTDSTDFTFKAAGTDTVFEYGYSNFTNDVKITFQNDTATGGTDNRANFPVGTNQIFVNGEAIEFDVNAGDTDQDIEDSINQSLKDNGFAFTVTADVTATATADMYDLTLKLHNVNYTNDTELTAKVTTASGLDQYQSSTPRASDYPNTTEKRVSDFTDFIENLYNGGVDAYMEDGKLVVQDIRSGSSKLSFTLSENNTGIGYPMLEDSVTLSGKYTGTKDDTWSFNITVDEKDPLDPADDTLSINVRDAAGNTIYKDTMLKDEYYGQDINISKGVSINLGDIDLSTSFKVDLKANSSVGFGDMNIIEDGSNVDTFRSLTNLYNALNLNIPESGIGAPSAWRDESLSSTSTPYFDGTFRGNYNEELIFEIMATNNLTEMYIQSEQNFTSTNLQYIPNSDIDFDLVVRDGDTVYTKNIFIDQDDIFNGLASPDTGTSASSLSLSSNSKLTLYYQDSGIWSQTDVTVPAGTYLTVNDVAAAINADPALPAGLSAVGNPDGTISFATGGTVTDVAVSGDSGEALGFEHFEPEDLIADAVKEQVKTDLTLSDLEVKTYYEDGQLIIKSGSGTHEISMNANNDGTNMMFINGRTGTGSYPVDLEFSTTQVLDLTYFDTGTSTWTTTQVSFPPDPSGEYSDTAALVASAVGLPAGVTLSSDTSGALVFDQGGTVTSLTVSANVAASGGTNASDTILGFYNQSGVNSINAVQEPTYSLAESSVGERTISFSYNDGIAKTASITIDAKDYADLDEMITEINSKLADEGLAGNITAESVGGNKISFSYNDTAYSSFHVSGDYEATLGFFKAGTESQVKVTGSDGELIAVYTVDTANETTHIVDGVYSGYDEGYLYATDSFTTAVGSGIEYELSVLEKAETQVTGSLTTVGTRVNRVESSINFYTTMSTTNEEIKAEYIGASAADQTAAITEYQLALQAYETTLSATARMLSVSLLDYL